MKNSEKKRREIEKSVNLWRKEKKKEKLCGEFKSSSSMFFKVLRVEAL